MSRLVLPPALAAALGLAACASGPPEPKRQPDRLESGRAMKPAALLLASFDEDHDYAVSADELDAGLARAFEQADEDGDGALSLMEHARWSRRTAGDAAARPGRFDFDANADSQITRAEFRETLQSFARRYAGDDGIIQFSELTTEAVGRGLAVERPQQQTLPDMPDPTERRRRDPY